MSGGSTSPQQDYGLTASAAKAAGPSRSVSALLWRRFLKHYLAVASLLFLISLAAITLATPLIESALGVDGDLANIFNAKQPASAGAQVPLHAADMPAARGPWPTA